MSPADNLSRGPGGKGAPLKAFNLKGVMTGRNYRTVETLAKEPKPPFSCFVPVGQLVRADRESYASELVFLGLRPRLLRGFGVRY